MTINVKKLKKRHKMSKKAKLVLVKSCQTFHYIFLGGGNSGGGGGGGSTVGMSSTSMNQPSRNKHKSPKQFELKYSLKALRALSARWALPDYPVFEDENSKASDEKSVKRKLALKKTDRTDIIATNFV